MEKLVKVMDNRGRVTIPAEIRCAVGFEYNDVLSFEVGEDDTVIIRKEKVCDCYDAEHEEKTESLLDVLNSLSPDQQAAALVHLSIKVAEYQRDNHVKV